MRVSRENLLNTLELVSPGLSTKGDLEQSNCFVFKEGQVITFNDETACRCKSPIDIEGAVYADTLRGILHKLKEDEIEVSQNKGGLFIRGKSRRRMEVRMEEKIELPLENLEKPKKWKPLSEKFSDAVEFVEGCAGRDEANFALTCIHLHQEYVEAFDNYQFARYRVKTDLKQELLVKQLSLRNIINLTMIEFSETDNWVHFRNARKVILSCRRYMDEYLDLDHIPKVKGTKIALPPGLADASDRAEVFSVHNPQENQIKVDLKPGWVTVKGTGQFGWYSERKKVNYSGKPRRFMIQPKMMMQLVKNHSECEVTQKALKAEAGPAVFVTSLAPAETPKKKGKE